MAEDLTPDEIATTRFRVTLRGYDASQVAAFLQRVSDSYRAVEDERERLEARLAAIGDRDLQAEFDRVTEDIARILSAARDAAEALRKSAVADANRWRTEARTEAGELRRTAQLDAEALRGDAWTTSEELLRQVTVEAARMREQAERDSLSILGEAEREAHRVVSSARREADDAVRVAKMEADRLLVDARSRHDEILDEARKGAEAAQERARALEVRRVELLTELESVRATIQRLERQIDERQAITAPNFEESATVRVIPPEAQEAEDVEDGEAAPTSPSGGVAPTSGDAQWETEDGVRIVPPPPRERRFEEAELPEGPVDATEVADEVRRLREAAAETAVEPHDDEETSIRRMAADRQAPPEAVEQLFATLRADLSGPREESAAEGEQPAGAEDADPAVDSSGERFKAEAAVDPFEVRDRLLLPLLNQALRNVKRRLTEEQNMALEELRTNADWEPVPGPVEKRLRDDTATLVEASYTAGSEAAARLLGTEVTGPEAEAGDLAHPSAVLAHALSDAVAGALREAKDAGQGPRQVASTVSKVYRVWRTDEAERNLHRIAAEAYHRGLVGAFRTAGVAATIWRVSGRGCSTCRAAGEAGAVAVGDAFSNGFTIPPAHLDCGCTLLPA
jgi:DivIVA domain-containing protein